LKIINKKDLVDFQDQMFKKIFFKIIYENNFFIKLMIISAIAMTNNLLSYIILKINFSFILIFILLLTLLQTEKKTNNPK